MPRKSRGQMYFHIVTWAFCFTRQKNAEIRGLHSNAVLEKFFQVALIVNLFLQIEFFYIGDTAMCIQLLKTDEA